MPLSNIFTAYTTKTTFVEAKIYSGGGLRINTISYFENPLSNTPSKKYAYDYRDINDLQRSSGALVFPEPILNYSESYSYKDKVSQPEIIYSADFDITTDYNILPVQKTQGADVGYKYVTVKQLNDAGNTKGKTVYTFRSPIDYPNEDILYSQMPVVPIPNQDYLRGQQISEKKYDVNNLLLSEVNTNHITHEYEKNDGIKIKDNFYNNMTSEYYSYPYYNDFLNHFSSSVILTTPYKNFERFGITLPSGKQDISYYYKNGVQSSIVSTSSTTYNTNDYPSVVTQNFANGNTQVLAYKYATEKVNQRLINANMIGIPLETETKENNNTVSKTETLYDNLSNFFPSSVISYDILNGATSYTEATYDKYDSKGNLQQYTTKDGISTVIIWGYDHTQPIAKIEGAQLSGISQSLIDTIVSASNTDAQNGSETSEQNLISALDTFRSDASLSGYQISTYTYDPLIGVRSITPPSGIREYYRYDAAGRLEKVIDSNNKVLKEFKYNYKN
ncbi:hypothetical protein [uncultured Chryseobacterium sp.]|uniref:hypothetical protein n=1 Tax=uncultured Chryseobacterium sp. TaxID=259322 RepID=UPI0025E29A31|nr:hypothetical protein [uncultured Chryseobacterium sp.]